MEEKIDYHFTNFCIEEFRGKNLERLIVCEDAKTKSAVFVYVKGQETKWHKYFLDAGIGFWENTEEDEYEDLEDEDDEFFTFKNYSEIFQIENKIIDKIFCEPISKNCQIIISFLSGERVILRCKDSDLFDSECEIVNRKVEL